MAQIKTNNSFLRDKIELRENHLPGGEIHVLDCFAGSGLIWQAIIARHPYRSIHVLPIDKQDYGGFHLPGDNRRYLMDLDLSRFNVIDLDAYGVPAEQLEIIFERRFMGIIFVTFIQSSYGIMPYDLLKIVGFTRDQIRKCPTLFAERGWQYMKEYLALRGVTRLDVREHGRKHYAAFAINGAAESGAGYNIQQVETAAGLS
jgi:hypothetical protein